MLNKLCYDLLKTWCDKMVEMQITERNHKGLFGGVLCESCGYIHGRCADAIYPMITMYSKTKDEKYLKCAENLFYWQKNNVRRSSGLNMNDTFNTWYGVTEFYQISLGLTLLTHKDVIPEEIYNLWYDDFFSVTESIYKMPLFIYRKGTTVATNYLVAYLTSMAVAYKVIGDEKYETEAIAQEDNILEMITEDGHFYGEAGGLRCTEKGHKNIDLGYNVEESIGNFALYAKLLDREEILKICAELLRKSAEFMLPDGAWDNSWGSRAVKWTYYGSRTSDGSHFAFRILADYDPMFYEMCLRYTLLMNEMTFDGLLSGGKMYKEAEMAPCVHHAFAHAKTLAYVVDNPFKKQERTSIPQDAEYGFKKLESAGVTLVSIGDFRGTMSATSLKFDANQTISGGSITCLYNKNYGVLFVSNAKRYVSVEPANMQIPYDVYKDICQTLRIDNGEFSSMLCLDGETTVIDNTYTVKGKLTNFSGSTSGEYQLSYTFLKDTVKITAKGNGVLQVPIVCAYDREVKLADNTVSFDNVIVSANKKINFREGYYKNRIFNPVGGFATLPLYIEIKDEKNVEISIKVTP